MPPLRIATDISLLFFRPERLPDSRDHYLWADYIELRCLLDPDHMISKSDLIEHIKKRKDLKEDSIDSVQGNEDEEDEIDTEESDTVGIDSTQGAKDDKRRLFGDDLFRHLEYRVGEFKKFYPFYLSKSGDVLIRKRKLSPGQKLYMFLLLSSHLKYLSKPDQSKLTEDFEVLSFQALRNYLPASAAVFMFGKNSLNRERYSGKLIDKVKLLAKDLHESILEDAEKISPRDTGDNGLDLVAWFHPGDLNKSLIIFFAQCACSSKDWVDKQGQSSYERWKGLLTFKVRPVNIIFMPYCYRDSLGNWHKAHKIQDSFMVDRLRTLYMLKDNFAEVMKLHSFKLVDKVAA